MNVFWCSAPERTFLLGHKRFYASTNLMLDLFLFVVGVAMSALLTLTIVELGAGLVYKRVRRYLVNLTR